MLCTINNIIQTLLFQASILPEFWVAALHTTAHLFNILPSVAINNDIPCTQLFETVPNYHHLRTSGCMCYPNLLPTSVHKFSQRSTPCVFIDYSTDHRGYRCLDLHTRRIILSCHVVFEETIFPLSHTSSLSSSSSAPVEFPPPPIPRQTKIINVSPPVITPTAHPSILPPNTHSMVTRGKNGIVKPRTPLCLHTDIYFSFTIVFCPSS